MKDRIKIGTRGSQLALYQANFVKTKIEMDFPTLPVEIVVIKTSGDMVRRGSMTGALETKRIFTKEIEDAMIAGDVDIAVHSAKDLTVFMPEGLKIGAVLEREDSRDCLVSRDHVKLHDLPLGARVGTSALRRKMQLLRHHPELIVEEIHGNVDTRIRKLENGEHDAIVLAFAGIKRLGLTNYVTEVFPEESFYPAPGQGTILVQNRFHDPETDEILEPLNHKPSAIRLACERAFLRKLEGGCNLPCGILTRLEGDVISLKGALFAVEAIEWAEASLEGPKEAPEDVGETLANLVLENGGLAILEKIKKLATEKKHPPQHPLA